MDLNKLIEENISKNRITGLTKPKIIKEMLSIPENINLKKLDQIINSCYSTFYIKKKWSKHQETEEEKYIRYLNIHQELSERIQQLPENADKTKYRKILVINEPWLKVSQKKLNKLLTSILLTKKEKAKKRESIVPYLHSSVKQRSYTTNAQAHIGDKYVFAIDLKDFYPSVTKVKIFNFFKKHFKLPSDIAMIYAVLSTYKSDNGEYCLGQGLSQSSTLAFLVNYRLFNYLYLEAQKLGIEMTIYVDDVIFSSSSPIPQKFINRLFGIIKENKMSIKRRKVYYYGKKQTKKITGIYIKKNKTSVAYEKHKEIRIQYNYLKEKIKEIKTFSDYLCIYNLYLKFYGNYHHILNVEKKINNKILNFVDKYDEFFPKGIHKKQKQPYSVQNIKTINDVQRLNKCYQKLKNKNLNEVILDYPNVNL